MDFRPWRGRAVGALACLGAVASSGCSLILDFQERPAPGPADAAQPDAKLVPDPCGVLEPNDDPSTAQVLTTGEARYAAICPGGDKDFYKVTLAANQTLAFYVRFKNRSGAGDIELSLQDSTGINNIADSRSFDDDEGVTCPKPAGAGPDCPQLAAGDYIVFVSGALPSVDNVYKLDVAITQNP
jgi:hypothetical protein